MPASQAQEYISNGLQEVYVALKFILLNSGKVWVHFTLPSKWVVTEQKKYVNSLDTGVDMVLRTGEGHHWPEIVAELNLEARGDLRSQMSDVSNPQDARQRPG